MIPADEVAPLAPEHSETVVETENLLLDDEEQMTFDFIDSDLDRDAAKFTGSVFLKAVPPGMATDKVIAKLKKMWERGGWIVEAFHTEDGGWLMAFGRMRGTVASKVVKAALEKRDVTPIESQENIVAHKLGLQPNTSCPLLVRMPTRGRPDQALEVLARYRELAESHVKIEVVIDDDDVTMNNSQVLQRLCELDCIVTTGRHKNKIAAVNGGRVDDWAILALASDDMVPAVQGYDQRIVEEMDRHFPLRDGLIYFNDGYNKDHMHDRQNVLCTMPIMGRHFWELFGYVYYPGYGSLYSDDEQTQVAWAMRRAAFIDEVIVEHRHHAAGKAAFDALYEHNDGKWGAADAQLFELRRQKNFEMPKVWLSLLICSTPERAPMLRRLVAWLRAQIRGFNCAHAVEIVVDDSGTAVSIGEKRQRLLSRAVGEYVAFIDDDDWVAYDYVERVLRAVVGGGPDCASLVGLMTTDGENPERFEHALKYSKWETVNGVHVRCPNHLNAVRRELALKVGFPSKNFGEDADYSMRLRELLKTEASTGDEPLYFYWYRSKK